MKLAPRKNGHSCHIDREHRASLHEREVMQWKKKSSDACSERAFQKESGPFIDQLSGKQPEQDYCPCSNCKEVAYRINESKNTHRCPPLLDPPVPLCALLAGTGNIPA